MSSLLLVAALLVGVVAGAGTCLMNGYVTQLSLSKQSLTVVTIDIDMHDDQVQLAADLPIQLGLAYVIVEAYAIVGTFPTLPDLSVDVSKGTALRADGHFLTGNKAGQVSFALKLACNADNVVKQFACDVFKTGTVSVSATRKRDFNPVIALLFNRPTAELRVKTGAFAYFTGVAEKNYRLFVETVTSFKSEPGIVVDKVEIQRFFSLNDDLPSTSSGTIGTAGLDVTAGQKFTIGLFVKSGSTIASTLGNEHTLFTANFGRDTEPLKSATPFNDGQCPMNVNGFTPGIAGGSAPPPETLSPMQASMILQNPAAMASPKTCLSNTDLSAYCQLQCSAQQGTVRTCACDAMNNPIVTCAVGNSASLCINTLTQCTMQCQSLPLEQCECDTSMENSVSYKIKCGKAPMMVFTNDVASMLLAVVVGLLPIVVML